MRAAGFIVSERQARRLFAGTGTGIGCAFDMFLVPERVNLELCSISFRTGEDDGCRTFVFASHTVAEDTLFASWSLERAAADDGGSRRRRGRGEVDCCLWDAIMGPFPLRQRAVGKREALLDQVLLRSSRKSNRKKQQRKGAVGVSTCRVLPSIAHRRGGDQPTMHACSREESGKRRVGNGVAGSASERLACSGAAPQPCLRSRTSALSFAAVGSCKSANAPQVPTDGPPS